MFLLGSLIGSVIIWTVTVAFHPIFLDDNMGTPGIVLIVTWMISLVLPIVTSTIGWLVFYVFTRKLALKTDNKMVLGIILGVLQYLMLIPILYLEKNSIVDASYAGLEAGVFGLWMMGSAIMYLSVFQYFSKAHNKE